MTEVTPCGDEGKSFLEISGVNPTGCKLSWKKPEDDGGSPISGYTVEKKDVERDTWVACGKLSGKTMAVMKVTTDVFSTLCITIFYFKAFRVLHVVF